MTVINYESATPQCFSRTFNACIADTEDNRSELKIFTKSEILFDSCGDDRPAMNEFIELGTTYRVTVTIEKVTQ